MGIDTRACRIGTGFVRIIKHTGLPVACAYPPGSDFNTALMPGGIGASWVTFRVGP